MNKPKHNALIVKKAEKRLQMIKSIQALSEMDIDKLHIMKPLTPLQKRFLKLWVKADNMSAISRKIGCTRSNIYMLMSKLTKTKLFILVEDGSVMIVKNKPTVEKPTGRCPECGYIFDCATNVDDDSAKPKIGDISFCIKCGSVNQFDEHGVITVDESKLDEESKREIKRIRRAWIKTRGSEYAG